VKPRLAFLGTGWIGRSRMEAILADGAAEAVALCDPSDECAELALAFAPEAVRTETLEGLLELAPDGLVIATPSAQHAAEAITALNRGVPVFCQKPLGVSAGEVRRVVGAARRADCLLGVDFSYRLAAAFAEAAALVRAGSLGKVHTVDLTFHNAYGPDKPWFYDRALSGGGCLMDLGVHLADLVLWLFGYPDVEVAAAALTAGGRPATAEDVEDFALATLKLAGGTTVRLACSWRAHAGRDAVIAAEFHGTSGGALVRNVGGSFHDFEAFRFTGTAREQIAAPPDAWGGRAAVAWARRLAGSHAYDPAAEGFITTAEVIEAIYAAGLAGIGSAESPRQARAPSRSHG